MGKDRMVREFERQERKQAARRAAEERRIGREARRVQRAFTHGGRRSK